MGIINYSGKFMIVGLWDALRVVYSYLIKSGFSYIIVFFGEN